MNKDVFTLLFDYLVRTDEQTLPLYSPMLGEVGILRLNDSCSARARTITVHSNSHGPFVLLGDGKFRRQGECMLFPSKEVRDWGLFDAWYTAAFTGGGRPNHMACRRLLREHGGVNADQVSFASGCVYYIDSVSGLVKSFPLFEHSNEYVYLLSHGHELPLRGGGSTGKPVGVGRGTITI